jgi:hypothetical protein
MKGKNGRFLAQDPTERFWSKVQLEDTIFPESSPWLTGRPSQYIVGVTNNVMDLFQTDCSSIIYVEYDIV